MVPEGAYSGPPPDAALWEKVRGRKLEVRFGTRGGEG